MPFSVSEKLKALRNASGLTQEAFAELAGMDYKTYQHIEAGRRPSVRLCTIEKICDAYGIELHQFFHPTLPQLSVTDKPRKRKRGK
ncbi:MAG: helix-turn-helix transcriptional regulator [Candidatus Spyradosoma sp.]